MSVEVKCPKLPNHHNKVKSKTALEVCRDFNAGCCMAARRQMGDLTAPPPQMDSAASRWALVALALPLSGVARSRRGDGHGRDKKTLLRSTGSLGH